MIHPNEWNNIPACIRSTIMGLIDFNDKMTQRFSNEDFILIQRIQKLEDVVRKQKFDVMLKVDEVDKKIDREIIKAMRSTKRTHEEIQKQQ